MLKNNSFLIFITLILIVLYSHPAQADVTLSPYGVAVALEVDAEETVEMTLGNDGGIDVSFRIRFATPEDEERHPPGPRRDDFGDRVAFYSQRNRGWCGMAWVGEEMCIVDWDNSQVYFWNIEEEEFVGNFRTNFTPWAAAWDGETLWISTDAQNRLINLDREGNQITTINLGYIPCGVAWDGNNLWTYPYGGDANLRRMTDEGEVLTTISCGNIRASACYAITWVPEHDTGHMWVISELGWLMQLNLDLENEEVQVVQEREFRTPGGTYGITHDSENIWYSIYSSADNQEWGWVVIDDGIEEPRWLLAEPNSGVIANDSEETFELLFNSTELEAGIYRMQILVELVEVEEERDDLSESLIEVSVIMSVDNDVADIVGVISCAAYHDLISGASIDLDPPVISRFSDDEGNYSIENLPLGDYELTFIASDFLPLTHEISLEEAGEYELDIALLHSVCLPSEENITWFLEPDMEETINFDVHNGGNGPLTYQIERRLLGEANAEPWQLRSMYNTEQMVEDDMINGVTFAEDHFYVSGGNNGGNPNMIYVFDNEGEQTGEFEQVHESRYGMRDLTYDGELIWGADDNVLYGYSLYGDHVETLEGEAQSYRSLTWDPENDWFWSADITSNIFATNREGNLVQTLNRPDDLRIYGLAYWLYDPDGHNLYVFSRTDEIDIAVYKINLDNGEAILVAEMEAAGSRPGGIHITNQFDIFNWVLMGIVQTPDRLGVWQLSERREWFQIDPEAGEIEAGGDQAFDLYLNSTDLPPDNRFEGELVFIHDGRGGYTHLPVRLDVQEGRIPWFRELNLNIGWNTVSLNFEPYDNDDIRELMSPLVEEDLLIMMKNGAGQFYIPEYDYNNILGWFAPQGYQLKMRSEAIFRLSGILVLSDDPIELTEGWHLISYYPRFPIETTIALSGIENNLIIAKDGHGNFYIPDWDFSNMGDMREGQGYYVNVDAFVNLIYRYERPDDEGAFASVPHFSVYDDPGQLPVHVVTGVNMSLLVLADQSLPAEIGVYTDGKLVGSGVLQNGVCGIAIWGDDPLTNEIDGALEGQSLEIRLLTDNGLTTPEYTVLAGETVYTTDGFAVVQLTASSAVPVKFGISSAYPNPFNSTIRISYSLNRGGFITLRLYDLAGREVANLVNERQSVGYYQTVLNAQDLSSGIYLVRLASGEQCHTQRIVLIK
ncbi:T9SS type A sorting domain-containing protein [bacterium]|nr:T9SS type A sorting domain-containing protein [bacterium]